MEAISVYRRVGKDLTGSDLGLPRCRRRAERRRRSGRRLEMIPVYRGVGKELSN